MEYIISYDISKDRTRTKVADLLVKYGIRLQYSVFRCRLTNNELKALEKEIAKLIDLKTDSVLFIPFCEKCEQKQYSIGSVYSIAKVNIMVS